MKKNNVHRECWCGAPDAYRLWTIDFDDWSTDYVRCGGCGVVAQHPIPSAEQLIPFYASEYYGKTRRKFVGPLGDLIEHFQSARARLVAAEVPQGARILDVGCGNGGFLMQMAERGFLTEGTEWTNESAARIPQDERLSVHVGDLLELKLAEGAYDAVTLWHAFEHLAAPAETVAEIYRLLKPGGLVFLALPNQESRQARRYGADWFHLDPPRHLYGFGLRPLIHLLKLSGFSVLHQSTWSLEQNPFGVVQSQLNAWGFPRERAYDVLKGVSKEGMATNMLDLLLVALLTAPALVYTSMEAVAGEGGTMTLTARKL